MIEIRQAMRADLPAIVRLLADDMLGATRERVEDTLPEAYTSAFAAIERQWGNRVLVAVQDETVVGCLQLTLIPGLSLTGTLRAQIEAVRVAAGHRGQGIGETLLRRATELARREGAGLMQLTTNVQRPEARRFYERLGFVASHVGMKLVLDSGGDGEVS